jgi:polyhydroxybutyrate depolymerase
MTRTTNPFLLAIFGMGICACGGSTAGHGGLGGGAGSGPAEGGNGGVLAGSGGSSASSTTAGAGTGGAAASGGVKGSGGVGAQGGMSGTGGATIGTGGAGVGTGGRGAGGTASGAGGTRTSGTGGGIGGQPSTGGQGGATQPVDGGASSGCGKPGAVTGAKTGQTITVAGKQRTYVLSVPTGYTGNTPLALVFAWHGANISGSLARSLFNLESKSSGAAIFVYPDGLPMNDGGMTGWDLSTGSADFQFFETLLAYLRSSYCIDSNRIFSTGHSMGAMMTNTLGCSYGDVLRAIAPASGTPPGGGRATCTGKVGAWIAHGENDPTVNFSQGQASRDFWIKQNGCTTETKTWASEPACVEYQGCQLDLPVIWCVHDEGHAWPVLTGRDCNPDAGVCFDGGSAVWAFFSSFK